MFKCKVVTHLDEFIHLLEFQNTELGIISLEDDSRFFRNVVVALVYHQTECQGKRVVLIHIVVAGCALDSDDEVRPVDFFHILPREVVVKPPVVEDLAVFIHWFEYQRYRH